MFNHFGALFTKKYIIIPEMPVMMNMFFDWKEIQRTWNPNGTFYWNVLCRESGALLRTYSMEAGFVWHSINAFENEHDDIILDVSWSPNGSESLNYFAEGTDQFNNQYFRRIVLTQQGNVTTRALTTQNPSKGKAAFGVVNPAIMWKEDSRYIFGCLLNETFNREKGIKPGFWNLIAKIDTQEEDNTLFWPGLEGYWYSPPEFLPKHPNSQDDGIIVMLLVNSTSFVPSIVIIDGKTMITEAIISLDRAKSVAGVGLHNHFSLYPTSV